ncbi:MAG TPA: DNA topoisomerase I [Calditrichia bacterium]|nr:DNA topoisomerase I [Calditrichia bacterium]HQV31376.1 DNA topoisomerase I [Calditrichia bacterium]
MAKKLVIVESPAKARTINKYLGKDFQVVASYGHVRDLIPKEGAVDTDDFSMKYEVISRNKKYVDEIIKAVKDADGLYLATDPDREGEAISWHVHEILKKRKLLKDLPVHRVVFHEITQSAISEAMAHPRDLSMELINAQQARRALDYLVGFNLSPLLWKKIRRGLSAGRVQSPALRLIVEREMEIEEFVPQEYWTIEADVRKEQQPFVARLTRFQNKKVEQFTVVTEKNALNVRQTLLDQAAGKLTVTAVERKKRKRNPSPPFITSTLQQEASRKLGFSAQRTMMIAQQLYEGVDVGSGEVGLITYMRTDSVSLAKEAISEIRQLIKSRFGEKNLPAKPHFYRTKSKNAQEAHEAIRPTSVMRSPEAVKSHLKPEQYKLYEMIWKRTVASQMIHATINTVAVDLACGPDSTFRATGSTIEDPGFMAVYMESFDEKGDSDEGRILPDMKEGDVVDLEDIRADQHFTKPPPRFTEASLIKMLEEYGIGRPSTYASIISTLLNREYAILESRRFLPTDVGRIVNRFLTQHFEQYVDYDFTANLEDQLDEVSRGEKEWIPLMSEFWKSFNQQLEEKSQLSREEVMDARNLGTDPRTGRPVSVRLGKFGPIVQIGTREDEEKPLFAGLQPGQSMQSITLEEALKLFQLPRNLGKTPEGEEVSASIGRFGPYVRYGKQFASIKEDDPYTITLERALEVIREKKEADANKTIQEFDGTEIKVLRGRYGPYITDGQKNARIPKGKEPEALTLAECLALLEKAPAKGARKRAPRKKSK